MADKNDNLITPSFESLIDIIKQKLEDYDKLNKIVDNDDIEKMITYLFENQYLGGGPQFSRGFERIIDQIVDLRIEKGEK